MPKYTYFQESKKNGKRIEELVKGSLDYQRYEIERAFRAQFPDAGGNYFWIGEVFADHVIVNQNTYDGPASASPLHADEFYSVSFTRQGASIVFQPREQWQVVELAYQPQSSLTESVWMMESASDTGARKIHIKRLMTAGEVNGNNRRYAAPVLQAAVEELRTHLHESAGQGRLMLLGEVEHPSDKGRRANLMETVIRWTDVEFDGRDVNATGLLAIESDGGRHIQALAAIGVVPGGSIRGYGMTEAVKLGGKQIEDVTELHITGIDVVTEASFSNSQTILESAAETPPTEENRMNLLDKLLALLKARPDLFIGVNESMLKAMTEAQLTTLWNKIDEAMGIDMSKIGVDEALRSMAEKAKKFDESQAQASIETAITEATKDLKYGDDHNRLFVEAIRAAKPQDAAAVKALVEAKRAEYDKLFAENKLAGMGMGNKPTIKGVQPVIESELGIPEFARGAFSIQESLVRADGRVVRNLINGKSINDQFAAKYLARFDQQYRAQLLAESRLLSEAEQTTDLNLPYSVSRAIVAEAFPTLVATGLFDVQMTDQAPTTNIWYETWAAESGLHNVISKETRVVTALNTWYDLAHKFMEIGTVTVTNNAENVTYTLGTDYVIDYMGGRIKGLATIAPGDTVKVSYHYDAIREGEMSAIQQGKMTLAYKSLTIAADRLATEISRETIVFSRAALGYDAVSKTLASLSRQIARRIDKGLMYLGLSAALSVTSNSGGDYDISGHNYQDLVEKLGVARIKIANRYYEPTSIICSLSNADELANWDGFSQAGSRADADLMANGYAGRVKGLPVFASTEMSDGYFLVANRELVMHRIFQTVQFRGPFPSYSSNKMVASEQYYCEEFNGTDAPVAEKGSYVAVV